ncbi:enoyl-CoA hydratase/isomerase family protein [Halorarius litoreus]|uniref:enoyl-CoA hydratase/isomerase family protein n=1 Tax=Halorarius litoreus TaxID=2962676 RepID=UPI0020CD87E4|nr:enoyl-CoA hydratase-related protein [Halorarius litoreus]
MYDHISYDVADGIATLTLDRPDVYNAFNEAMIAEMNDALGRVKRDDAVYSLLLTGAGDGFCTGADVSTMPDWAAQSKAEYGAFLGEVQDVVRQLRSLGKPSVAAVNGPAVGAGCDFALACDVRYIGPNAYLTEGFVNVGLVPGDGGAWLLPKLIGESKAREFLLTGKKIQPEAAEDLGLVSGVADDVVAAAHEFAETVTNKPAVAVQRTNRLVGAGASFDEHCERAIDYQWECVNDPEHEEAVAALREGRDPEYDR